MTRYVLIRVSEDARRILKIEASKNNTSMTNFLEKVLRKEAHKEEKEMNKNREGFKNDFRFF